MAREDADARRARRQTTVRGSPHDHHTDGRRECMNYFEFGGFEHAHAHTASTTRARFQFAIFRFLFPNTHETTENSLIH